MSRENVEIVQGGYSRFQATGQLQSEIATPDFVWSMSHFRGWPEQQLYEGVRGAETFLEEWGAAWDDWELEVKELHDAGDKVVAIVHQRGTSKTSGALVEMLFAQVWTLRQGKEARMDMYSDPREALTAVGLEDG